MPFRVPVIHAEDMRMTASSKRRKHFISYGDASCPLAQTGSAELASLTKTYDTFNGEKNTGIMTDNPLNPLANASKVSGLRQKLINFIFPEVDDMFPLMILAWTYRIAVSRAATSYPPVQYITYIASLLHTLHSQVKSVSYRTQHTCKIKPTSYFAARNTLASRKSMAKELHNTQADEKACRSNV